MKFTIDWGAMASVLPVMLYGMLGGLAVMLVIYLVLTLLHQISKKKEA